MMQILDSACFLIDFDGTLVDSEPIHLKANSEAFASFGHRMDPSEYYRHWSLLGEGPAGEISRHQLHHIDEKTVRALGKDIFARLIHTEPIPLLPGARELINFLVLHTKRAVIASNTPPEFIRIMMDRAGLLDCPLPIIGGRDGLRGKPHPDIFLEAIRFMSETPEICIAIEDTLKGLKAAQTAGVACIVVPSPRYPDVTYDGAASVCGSLFDVVEMIRNQPLSGTSGSCMPS